MTATASGAQIPDYPQVSSRQTPVDHAAGFTMDAEDMFKIHTNTGEADNSAWELPKAADVPGCVFRAHATVAQTITFEPAAATEKINLHGDAVANKHLVLAGVIGNYVDLYSDGEQWIVARHSGVLTKEA